MRAADIIGDPVPEAIRRERRSQRRADGWQDRFDRMILVASVLAVVGVALQTVHPSEALPWLGFFASTASWLIFTVDVAVMLTVAPHPLGWARAHVVELAVLASACPVWSVFFYDLLLLQLTPALTVLEATKLAKLAKIARLMRHRGGGQTGGRLLAATVLLGAAVVAVLVSCS